MKNHGDFLAIDASYLLNLHFIHWPSSDHNMCFNSLPVFWWTICAEGAGDKTR